MKKLIAGKNWLHQHSKMQENLKVDFNHVIVDKKDWLEAIEILNNQKQIELL